MGNARSTKRDIERARQERAAAKRERRQARGPAEVAPDTEIVAPRESQDEILAAFPAGKLPPVEKTTLRDPAELAPYLQEPMSPGWKSVYGLPLVGPR